MYCQSNINILSIYHNNPVLEAMVPPRANEPVPVRERWKIVEWVVFQNGSVLEVANRLERSLPAIYKYVKLFLQTGGVVSDHERQKKDGTRKRKRRRIIEDDPFAITYLKHAMIGKADTTLKEYQSQLLKYGVRASLSTIHRHFISNGITTKVTTKV